MQRVILQLSTHSRQPSAPHSAAIVSVDSKSARQTLLQFKSPITKMAQEDEQLIVNGEELQPVEEDEPEERLDDEEEEEGEDLLENMEQDYRENSALDQYEEEGLDEDAEEVLEMDDLLAARAAAEEEMARRDARQPGRAGRGLPAALAGDDDEGDDDLARARRQRRRRTSMGDVDFDDQDPGEVPFNLEEVRGRLTEWIASEQVCREIKRRFARFLRTFKEEGSEQLLYMDRIRDMMSSGRQNLEVKYVHLSKSNPELSMWLADCPKQMLEYFDQASREVVLSKFKGADEDHMKFEGKELEVHVRIAELPLQDRLRDLRNYHLNGLVRVSGVVTRRTGVFPQLKVVKYDCLKCGHVLGPFAQNSEGEEVKPSACPNCSGKGPFTVNSAQTVYRDYQKLTLQESPGSVPAGRLPRHKEVVLQHDLIDCARPGEEIEVTGVYVYGYDANLNVKNSFPVFSTHIEANYVYKREDAYAMHSLTEEDREALLRMSKDPRIGHRIMKSIAPAIYGHEFIKTGMAMALFGGVEKHPSPAYRLRGDINMLLLGDPGVAKSQFLKYAEKTSSRAVYTTGKGASAVGLTAAVHKDPITKEWTLEGGALVLADKGVCLIDEFDKMNDQDRVSIHEAMEQQSISISKAGIVTQLTARCSVIAAANPVGGRYDPSRTFAENVDLGDTILSRFDILCVVRDTVDPVADQRLAEFVVGSHRRNHPLSHERDQQQEEQPAQQPLDPDMIPQDMLKKYITYAKQHCRPQLQQADYERMQRVYTELRKAAAVSHGMPIGVRHLESLIRMSEAHAKMHLRTYVSDEDINAAIRQLVGSFIQTQKYSVQKVMERRFKQFLTQGSDYHQLLLSLLKGLLQDTVRAARLTGDLPANEYRIPVRSLEEKAREMEISDLKDFLDSQLFSGSGFTLPAGSAYITCPAL